MYRAARADPTSLRSLAFQRTAIPAGPEILTRRFQEFWRLRSGDDALRAAFERGLADRVFGSEYISHFLTNTLGLVAGAAAQHELFV